MNNYTPFRRISVIQTLLRKSVELRRSKKYSKTTKMLLIVSSSFLLFNSPIALSKIYYFLKSKINYDDKLSNTQNDMKENSLNASSIQLTNSYNIQLNTNSMEEIVERITCYVYYLNFCLNFIVYNLNSAKFRNALFELLKFSKKK